MKLDTALFAARQDASAEIVGRIRRDQTSLERACQKVAAHWRTIITIAGVSRSSCQADRDRRTAEQTIEFGAGDAPICSVHRVRWGQCPGEEPCRAPAMPFCGFCFREGSATTCACIIPDPAKPAPTTGMFAKAPTRPRRKLQLSRFDPGEHFYLRFPTGIMPGGDRATDEKYDTIELARTAAADMGYDIMDSLLVVDSSGDTTVQSLK